MTNSDGSKTTAAGDGGGAAAAGRRRLRPVDALGKRATFDRRERPPLLLFDSLPEADRQHGDSLFLVYVLKCEDAKTHRGRILCYYRTHIDS